MADSFQSSKVASNEQSSSAKFNNFVQAVEDAINSLDNSNISAAAAIVVSKLAAGSNGDSLQTVAGVPTWVAGSGAPGYATTLPGSPTNGQETILVDSTTAPTYVWRFRYNSSSSSAFKWEFIGGTPKVVTVDTEQSTGSTSYVDLGTDGPSFILPNAGDYQMTWGGYAFAASGFVDGFFGLHVNAVSVRDGQVFAGALTGGADEATFRHIHAGASASHVAKVRYKVNSGTGSFGRRRLEVLPVRVS